MDWVAKGEGQSGNPSLLAVTLINQNKGHRNISPKFSRQ